ncbi:MAG: hypothetical protein LDL50_05095 [Chloroflexi bacterium]|nr:hypothetical protein [Chloroflexota bacterium]MCA2001369.1 hypothetical protein [Chloroflexota bacterium]
MNFRKSLFALLLLALTLAPRLAALDAFVTLDEPFWLSVGANYYYALGQRELENTVYEYHPAVTTMSFIAAAFLADFPEYRGLGQGYFDVDKEKFDPFLIEHGHDPLRLLYLSRLFQVWTIALLALSIFHFFSLFWGTEKAFLAAGFISSAPYFLGHSRLLSHEALVAFLVLASILGLFAYLEYKPKGRYLFFSAAAAALAQLTKSSAMAMFPVIGLILAVDVFEKAGERGFKAALFSRLKILGVWLAALCFVYFIVWPGMWVAPGKMLYEVYGNAFSYAFQGARLQVTQELKPSAFSLDAAGSTVALFVESLAWRATPLTWAGLPLAVVFLFQPGSAALKKLNFYFLLNAAAFILLFSLARGRNSPHYIMASHVSVDAIAALGWASLLGFLETKWASFRAAPAAGFAALLAGLQLSAAAAFFPYYYTYYNPLWAAAAGKPYASDYGEGFEKAAAYLAQKPDAKSITVFAFRARGAFSYFFPGRTIIFNPLFVEEPQMESVFERLRQSDYLVVNDAFAPRTSRTALFAGELKKTPPEHSIYIEGVSPIHIFRVADLPPSFYRALSEEEIP